MTTFLNKIFIKNHGDVKDPKVRESYGTFSSVVGIIVNVILAAIKFLAGIISGSVAIIADAVNNLSDSGSSAVSFLSFKMAAKPADRDHPFGHARIEYIASMIVAFLILTVGFEFFSDSLTKVFSHADATEIDVSLTTIIILSVSILLKLWLSVFYKANGRLIGSGVLCAAATDSFFDMISTSAVLVCSIIIKLTHFIIIDAIAGIGLSVMIMVAGIRLLNDTKNSLLGEAPIDETVESIEAVVR